MQINVSSVDNRSKPRASSIASRNVRETSGKRLVRIHKHLAALLGSARGMSPGDALVHDGPGRSEEFVGGKNALEMGSSESERSTESLVSKQTVMLHRRASETLS